MGDNADRVPSLPPAEAILDALPRAVIAADREMTIIAWNVVAERLYGWPARDAVGRSVYDLITPPELLESARAVTSQVLAGRPWSGDLRVVRRDGGQRITFAWINPIVDANGRTIGALSAADDVTDLRGLEREASRVADHLVLALAAGDLGTWRWDRTSGEMTWDATMCRLFGIQPAAFEGTIESWMQRIHPDDLQRSVDTLDRGIREQGSYEIEHRVVWPDGSLHWINGRGKVILDEAGEAVGTIGCATDTTDRKLAEIDVVQRAREAERLAVEEARQRVRLEFLVELNDVAIHAIDHHEVMQRTAFAAVPRLGDWCTVHFVPQPGVHEVEVAHAEPDRLEWARDLRERYPLDPEAAFGVPAVLRTGRTEFIAGIDRYLDDPALAELAAQVPDDLRAIIRALGLTSIITVPLLTQRGVIGAMQFVTAESGRRYGVDDVALAEAAAGRIAAALDNAWFSEQQREIASTLQSALLPTRLPTIPGVGIAVRYWAAGAVSEVGGDFYDVFPIDDRRWAVVIGDVCGTGAEAAAITSTARHTIRAAASHGVPAREVLRWVNDAVRLDGDGRFCTIAYVELEAIGDGRWSTTTVIGGHPLPVVVDADGLVGALGQHGTLIGVLEQIRVTVVQQVHAPGSTIVMHTDGVNDVRPPHDLDDAAVRAMVTDAVRAGASADEIADRLGDAVAAVLPIPERDDDIALVVLRIA